jgi:hypothetical protein
MPTAAVSHAQRDTPTSAKTNHSKTGLDFPHDHHLLVTTENHVCCWNVRGLTSVFKSSSGGILASREAKDGSGKLAVADSQTVLLHDVSKGMDRSYRLKGTEVR